MEWLIVGAALVIAMLCVIIIVMLSKLKKGDEGKQLSSLVKSQGESYTLRLENVSKLVERQDERLDRRLAGVEEKLDRRLLEMDTKLTKQVDAMLSSNEKKLEEMRATVDEKLSSTLQKRLDSSFEQVSQRLEAVYKGLGEMQSLANGVGDLKRVLTNVKTRGIWGEIQLGTILEQMLTRSQYAENIAVIPGSADRVEFALIIPSKDDDDKPVYIPIDSKYPVEDYQRLLDAQDHGDKDAVEAAYGALERAIKTQAKKIKDKYIKEPHTTNFAIMFLPTEGLFAEVLRRGALCQELQSKFNVTVTGPTTLSAFLSSLQMGFRTLAVEKQSAEVWELLGAIKGEFGKFAGILEKTQQRLNQASTEIESATKKTRTIERKLRNVESVEGDTAKLLGIDGDVE